jgi:CRISPR-associated protein Csd2
MTAIQNRYDFVYLFDVENGNPNGDPDAGNMPRVDPETSHGLVTDVCLKRKIRNYILLNVSDNRNRIFVKEKAVLNRTIELSYEEDELLKKLFSEWLAWEKDKKKNKRPERHYEDLARDWMCRNFYDVRAFGAVMTTGDKKREESEGQKSKLRKTAGQVRGPVQFGFAKSVDPIVPLEISITRMAVTNEADLEKERTMGRKHIVPYGLYRCHGFVSASLADNSIQEDGVRRNGTGFSEKDLDLLWEALINMFDHDRSAARGEMTARKLIVFEHESKLGNFRAHKLFERVKVSRANDPVKPARSFEDYVVAIDKSPINGVRIDEKL